MTDQNRKTLRSFYCRDYLWELFEQMTHELGCSMDYLINESMRMYARSRDFPSEANAPTGGYNAPGIGGVSGGMSGPPQPTGQFGAGPSGGFQSGNMEHRTFDRIPPVGNQPPPPRPGGGFNTSAMPPAPPAPMGGIAPGPPPPPPRPGQGAQQGWGGQPPPQPPRPTMGQPQQPQQPQQPPPPQQQGFAQPVTNSRPPLYLIFNNNRYAIDRDKFVIGRGSQQTDLTIRDGNISRQHCGVIFHNGAYYIKDMGSTNGIEFRSNRIESKKIDEGDVFYLCDYELRFTYH